MKLLQYEMQKLPVLPLSLPYPTHKTLAERCRQFLANPTVHQTIDEWCALLSISRRSFTRMFRQETGLSFVAWRQQACLLAALTRLAEGESVTTVALNLGYNNPAAFTTMFKRILGVPPRNYLRRPVSRYELHPKSWTPIQPSGYFLWRNMTRNLSRQ